MKNNKLKHTDLYYITHKQNIDDDSSDKVLTGEEEINVLIQEFIDSTAHNQMRAYEIFSILKERTFNNRIWFAIAQKLPQGYFLDCVCDRILQCNTCAQEHVMFIFKNAQSVFLKEMADGIVQKYAHSCKIRSA